jgi:hypothetical protein
VYPGSAKVQRLLHAAIEGQDFSSEIAALRHASAEPEGNLPRARMIPLRTFDHRAVRHHPGVALRAGSIADFNHAPLPDHVLPKRHDASGRQRHLSLRVQVWFTYGFAQHILRGRVEYEFTSANPVRFRLQRRRVEDDLRLLLLQPFEVSVRLSARRVDRIALVDGPYGQLVIHVRLDVDGRVRRIRERDLQCRDRVIVPGLRNRRRERRAGLVRASKEA